MSATMSEFNASVFITEQLNRLIVNAAMDLAKRSVAECASKYEFDAEDAFRFLGLQNVKLERSKPVAAKKAPKEKAVKMAFPLPYNGECAAGCCSALRQNQGLYTQCTAAPKKGQLFCKACQVNADKNGGVPEYGTITMRQSVGIFEYVDPKGRKPVAYTKVMKKYKVDQAAVLEEAAKFGIKVNDEHFIAPAETSKGRPKKEKVVKEKGAKGRPKKDKKKLQIEGDDDDLFASLVADANATATAEPAKKKGKSDEEKEQERIAKENEKKEKEAKRAAEKAEKEAKLAAEKAAKEAKAAEEKAARELKKKQEEEEKAAKKAAAEKAKKEKEEKLAAEKAEKEAKKAGKSAKKASEGKSAKPEPEPEVEEEPDVVKKIEFEGKKYLKSKKSGIVYDYNEYVKNGEQVVVGKWNDDKNKIDFANKEEEEEEYTM
jgi:chemotaxis protein histidine kinase CheA